MKSVVTSVLALTFVFGLPGAVSAESQAPSTRDSGISVTVRNCAAPILKTREDKILVAWEKYTLQIHGAYEARAYALNNAWSSVDLSVKDFKAERKAAWDVYKKQIKESKKALRTARKEAWAEFKEGFKKCKVPAEAIDSEKSDTEA